MGPARPRMTPMRDFKIFDCVKHFTCPYGTHMGNMHKIIRKLLRARVFPAWFPQGSHTRPVSALTILWWKTYIYQTEQGQRNIGRYTYTIVSLFTILEISRWITCTDYNWSCGSRTCFVRNRYMTQTVWNTLKSPGVLRVYLTKI